MFATEAKPFGLLLVWLWYGFVRCQKRKEFAWLKSYWQGSYNIFISSSICSSQCDEITRWHARWLIGALSRLQRLNWAELSDKIHLVRAETHNTPITLTWANSFQSLVNCFLSATSNFTHYSAVVFYSPSNVTQEHLNCAFIRSEPDNFVFNV